MKETITIEKWKLHALIVIGVVGLIALLIVGSIFHLLPLG